ncbi:MULTISPECIES: FtsW/RodA/SpoVE family cell cycle protein [Nonlabens]|uniref:FtsW/RodA/SpoVE family cell cycle protein n=1 Tax=Nonlabens TaxID=363408 RepID=UPI000CEC40E3|nr:FtsW/RodA/SpoVE family cell cycle protein [Nonlabens xylanidelens]PQJ21395.1 cell division protein FtsW [Nonlabens xylanidelens]
MRIKNYISGDTFLWALVIILLVFSFLPVYSASANLAYIGKGTGNTTKFLVKHFGHVVIGLGLLYSVHKIPYRYFRGLSVLLLPVVIILLGYTAMQGTVMGGASASRWMTVPVIGMKFQTSTFAFVVLMAYVAKYLASIKDKVVTFKESILPLWVPVGIILMLIVPFNLSTAVLIFAMILLICFVGGYPLKYLLAMLGVGFVALTLFVLTAKAFPGVFPNRVDTWVSRIATFGGEGDSDSTYQVERAKTAIANGYIVGVGPGKSVTKHVLPQSASDFIFAIILEEFGIIGGLIILSLYLFFLFRLIIISTKAASVFGQLLVIGVGFPIVFQALTNMAVAVNLIPVTGQTLPLISSGGTSILMTCMAVGIVLSVSAQREEVKAREKIKEDEMNPLDVLSEAI